MESISFNGEPLVKLDDSAFAFYKANCHVIYSGQSLDNATITRFFSDAVFVRDEIMPEGVYRMERLSEQSDEILESIGLMRIPEDEKIPAKNSD